MAPAYKDILYELKDHVARITINRPKQYNAFTGDTLRELMLAFEVAGRDEEVGVIVLTGSGDKAFCAGGDVNWEKEGGLERQVLEPYLQKIEDRLDPNQPYQPNAPLEQDLQKMLPANPPRNAATDGFWK